MFPFEHESFRGDYFQWELLKDRPDIESSNKMNPQLPKKILSTTKYKTITNFGIFYYNKLNNNFINEIDMLYIIPEFISTNKIPLTKEQRGATFSITESYCCSHRCKLRHHECLRRHLDCHACLERTCGYNICKMMDKCILDECLRTCNLNFYWEQMLLGRIGSPIEFSMGATTYLMTIINSIIHSNKNKKSQYNDINTEILETIASNLHEINDKTDSDKTIALIPQDKLKHGNILFINSNFEEKEFLSEVPFHKE